MTLPEVGVIRKENDKDLNEKFKLLKGEFPYLTTETKEVSSTIFDQKFINTRRTVKGLTGNEDLTLHVSHDKDIENLKVLLNNQLYLFKDFVAISYGNTIEILLSSITDPRTIGSEINESTHIEANLNYYKTKINAVLKAGSPDALLNKFIRLVPRLRFRYRKHFVLILNDFKTSTNEGIVTEVRNILNSLLFDIEYTYGLAFETINLDSYRIVPRKKLTFNELPNDPIDLVYKKYIPELIEYFHIGYKVDYLPFKYICYFHIIEYFSDKSAYLIVAKQVKNLILKPDFHLKINDYVSQAINIFKKENSKYTSDKIKIKRVLQEFIDISEFKNFLDQLSLLAYFENDATLRCNKDLVLPAIDFSNENKFYDALTSRIYSVRCSIVHSNPDFEESKAVPFIPIPENLEILRKEIFMMTEVARTIIAKSSEY